MVWINSLERPWAIRQERQKEAPVGELNLKKRLFLRRGNSEGKVHITYSGDAFEREGILVWGGALSGKNKHRRGRLQNFNEG